MNHYSAFLRPHHVKSSSTTSNSSSNNENDENTSIKSLIFKHFSKSQHNSLNINNNTKGTMRGILGEVGNMTLSNTQMPAMITKPKVFQQHHQQSLATIVETTSTISAPPPPAPPPPLSTTTIIPIVVDKIQNVSLDDDEDDKLIYHEPIRRLTKVPSEFDCDSGDSYNITTACEYVVDICKYWRELEQLTPIRQNFLLNRVEGKFERVNLFYGIISSI